MPHLISRSLCLTAISAAVLLLGSTSPVMLAAQSHHHPAHGAVMTVRPRCITVGGRHRKLHIFLRHGTRGVNYTFALVQLFGAGRITGPSMGRHRANRAGQIYFHFPVPNHKRDVGDWQVTATRKLNGGRFKLAAIAHFHVRWGRCRRR